MTTLSIIFFILSAIAIIASFILLGKRDPFLAALTTIVAISCLVLSFKVRRDAKMQEFPTKQDVLDGKAVYQETIHITNSDTIKTYEIVWKK